MNNTYQESGPVQIIIGGTRLPKSYKDVDSKRNGDYESIQGNILGSNAYVDEFLNPNQIVISIDHRDRPHILCDAFNHKLWEGVDLQKIDQIIFYHFGDDKRINDMYNILGDEHIGKIEHIEYGC